ncbi:alpha/beta fold hydrolase [Rhodanobacter sp. UC4450_H17]|jgi:pimeloyl-ACP methyl ester carboxylesterase
MSTERAFRFGRAQHLVGVAGLPDAATPAAPVGVIVLNAGMVHRVGPFRLHVELTRRLNADGYPTLRFDLSSLGDSSAADEAGSQAQQVKADVADAMSLLASHAGCSRFVLLGLCSGAQNAHGVALDEPRVAGAVFLDGYAYRTLGFRLRHYLPRLWSGSRWQRFISRSLQARASQGDDVFAVRFPPREQVQRELATMLDRGLRLHFIYSGGVTRYFNHPRQFRECFGRLADRPQISARLFAGSDHTYALQVDRRRLLDDIATWLRDNFPISGGSNP